jgi:hypothetical protein
MDGRSPFNEASCSEVLTEKRLREKRVPRHPARTPPPEDGAS